jgi:hypothetical protein
LQTTIDGPFPAVVHSWQQRVDDDAFIVLRSDDGGLELLAESVTFRASPEDVRTLLFLGSTVSLEAEGGQKAVLRIDPRRYSVVLTYRARLFVSPRWAITSIARGRLPAAYLQNGRPAKHATLSASRDRSDSTRTADVAG